MAGVLGMAFIPYYNHLIDLLETNAELKRTARGIGTQLCWAGGGTVVGGIVGGPPGAMVGGIVGSVVGYCRADPYQSLVKTLRNLSRKEKAELVAKVQGLVGSTSIEALTRFIAGQAHREVLLNLLRKFSEEFKGG